MFLPENRIPAHPGEILLEEFLVPTGISQAALHGVSTKGSTCYVTHFPCINCTKALINAGITRLVYNSVYRMDENAVSLLQTANIEICQVDFKNGSGAL